MPIQAVFFDMGGTIETFSYTREMRLQAMPGFRDILSQVGISLQMSNEQLLDLVIEGHARYHEWRKKNMLELPTIRVWQEYTFSGLALEPKALASISEELMFYYENQLYQRVMRPEIPTVLEALCRKDLKLGVISNISSKGLVPANLRKYGIEHYFGTVVLSSEYGGRKPDPAIFHYAARMASVPASRCLYVGDQIARDIIGAHKAGYTAAVQIKHDFRQGEDTIIDTPDAVITDMTELIDIVKDNQQQTVNLSPGIPNQIRAVFFDAGDILYFRKRTKLPVFLQDLGLSFDEHDSLERLHLSDLAYEGKISQEEYREETLRLYGVTDSEQIARGICIMEEEDQKVFFFEGISDTLTALKNSGFLLGIITDTAHSVSAKIRWFERGGFGNVWDTIISSKELGVRKPKSEIYHAAMTQLGVRGSESVFVGHKTSELEGARAVGMKTIAFNYDDNAQADVYILNFSELLSVPFLAR